MSDDRDDHRVVLGAAKDAMDPSWTERCYPLLKTKMTKVSSKFVKMASASLDQFLAQVDEDRAGDAGVDGPITCQPVWG